MDGNRSGGWKPYVVLTFMPLFFSSNLIFGRAASSAVEPWTFAFLRWFFAFVILLPFAWRGIAENASLLRAQWKTIGLLGFLGMWICGAMVYHALHFTTATNATLIYTSSPVLILLLEWAFRGRRMGAREVVGVGLALIGVIMIIVKGSLAVLWGLTFNIGDLFMALAAVSWAIYSVLLKRRGLAEVPTSSIFAVVAGAGALTLLPFMLWESFATQSFPATMEAWTAIAGTVVFVSLLAFSFYQYGVATVGPSVTGFFMYLLPPYGVVMAVVFLGEALRPFHFVGFACVMAGLLLATLPSDAWNRMTFRRAGPGI
ncbi:DMT family transporter [Roseibium sp.]|uniref:DMT family transporter n=1 Tax=Roseibium sp. TaxID=1936156 RepID=UPI003A979A02